MAHYRVTFTVKKQRLRSSTLRNKLLLALRLIGLAPLSFSIERVTRRRRP